jgi:uncharacterized membrane protein
MEDNLIHNNPLAFWAGLVLFFIGLVGMVFYLFVRTATESAIMPGPTFRLKHFIVALLVALAGAVIASFARPRGSAISETTSYNR